MTASFTVFAYLPPELRIKIWLEAMPDDLGPPLYLYRVKGCWCVRKLKASDPGYVRGAGDIAVEFRTFRLGGRHRFHVPHISVNGEARSIAIHWLDKQGFDTKNLQVHHCTITRPFNCGSDTIYVSDQDYWSSFLGEPRKEMERLQLSDRKVRVRPNFTRLAVPESFFMQPNLLKSLPDVEKWMDLRVVFVVVGEELDIRLMTVRWELEDVDRGVFMWDRERQDFEFRSGTETLIDKDAYQRIGDAARAHLRDGLRKHHRLKTLEIRPVSAERKYNCIW